MCHDHAIFIEHIIFSTSLLMNLSQRLMHF